jgi:predicted nucleic acid-binding protein
LLLAKEQGLIPRVAPLLTELQNAGLYLATDLVSAVLRRAGEEAPA